MPLKITYQGTIINMGFPMVPYRNEKIQNAIAYFAEQHRLRVRRPLYQTFLFKYLAFFDFFCLKETGRPSLELV